MLNSSVVASDALENGPDLFRMVQAFGRAAGTEESVVAASLLCQAWAVSVTRLAVPGLVARRAPDVAASNIELVTDGGGRPASASPVTPRFTVVAGGRDSVPGGRDEVVADEEAFFALARRRLFDEHLGLLVEALHDRFPVGRRLLWGNVAAATAGRFAALSAGPDPAGGPFDPDRLVQDARSLLDTAGSPTEGLADLFPVAHAGTTRLFVRRQTCCLRYRLPDAPPTCLSCRLVPEAERRRRIGLAG